MAPVRRKATVNPMKLHQRILSLLLAGLMLLPALASCADPKDPASEPSATVAEDTSADSAPQSQEDESETEPDRLVEALEELRAEVDWGGKNFGFLYVDNVAGYTEEIEAVEKADSTLSSAVINDAVWERNVLFEEYGKLKMVLIPQNHSQIKTTVSAEVQSGTGDFHLITTTTDVTASMGTGNYLYDYLKLDNIDYEQPWWDQSTLDFALGGHVFFMNGPFNIVDDDVTFVMMFNKGLVADNHVANPYDTVRASEWTLDYFNSVISSYSAEDGDGKWDENDTYGFSTPDSIGSTLFYGADLQYIVNSRDMEKPELSLNETKMERALQVLEIARSIVHENHSTYVAAAGSEALSKEVFLEGRSMFYTEAISYLRGLNAEMVAEYGVLPIPKYDTAQENYTTWSASIGSTLSIPTTVARGDVEQFGNVLELYAILSQKLVRPAYYDSVLTVRNVRDAESAEMVDMIFQHRIYDMAIYFEFGFSSLFGESVSGSNSFSSSYASKATTFERRLERLLEGMED